MDAISPETVSDAPSAPPALKILFLDASAADTGLMQRQLQKAGIAFIALRVETHAQFIAALDAFAPDVVLMTDSLPGFSVREALRDVRRGHPEIPVVMVADMMGEEAAIELLKAGAKDYVLKNNLLRVPPAVERAIAIEQGIRARKAAEQALRRSEARFRDLVEDVHDIIWEVDTNWAFTYVSPQAERIVGYDQAALIGTPVANLVVEADRARVSDVLASLSQGGGTLNLFEVRCRHRCGREIVVEVNGNPIIGDSGACIGFRGVTRDVTERKKADDDLRDSEQRFRLLVEEAPDAILLYDSDLDRFVDANRAAEELFACSRDEIMRHGPQHYYQAQQPDGRPPRETFATHNTAARAGQLVKFERRITNAAGAERLCEVTLCRLPAPTTGHLLRASFVDVTEQRQAQRELAANAALLATEHEASPDGILVVDHAARILSFNQRFVGLFGVPADLVAASADEPLLAWVANKMKDRERFLARIRELYADRAATGRDEIALIDGRVVDRFTMPMHRSDGDYLGRVWFFRDITDKVEAQRNLERLNRTLRTLSRGNEIVIRAADEAELFGEMCRAIVETGGYRMAWIGLVEHDAAKSVTAAASAGAIGQYLSKARITWAKTARGNGPHGRAVRSGEPQVTQDLAHDPSMRPWREEARRCGFASSVVLPLKNDEVFALLMIYAGEPDAFDGQALQLLQELAGDLAYGVRALREHNRREATERRWQASLEGTIGAVASTVDVRDPYTAGHQQRVAQLAVAIARELGFAEDEVHGLYLASIIHDVGKVTIPAEILAKPGRLSELEYRLIQGHAEAVYSIIKGIDFPWPIAEIVWQHHERLDGSGYPRGLTDEAILPQAKILAVADVVESMMSHRPYRPGLGLEAALEEITDGAGSRYDRAAVEACVALFRSGRFALS